LVSKDGIDGVGNKLFKLCAKLPQCEKSLSYNGLPARFGIAGGSPCARKICDSLICCAPHNK
jgi:hypothetical protein